MSRQSVAGSGFALGRVKLLEGVAPERLERLSQECAWYRYAKGTQVIAQQDRGREVYFIASGSVRVRAYSTGGRQVSFRDLSAGEIFGDIAAVDGGPRTSDVVALAESMLAVLPATTFLSLLREHPAMHERYLRDLTGLIRQLTARVGELSTLAVPHRVQAELLRLARRGGGAGGIGTIGSAPTHAELADQIGTTREQVTRELSALARRGLFRKQGDAWVVTDLDALERLINATTPATNPRGREPVA